MKRWYFIWQPMVSRQAANAFFGRLQSRVPRSLNGKRFNAAKSSLNGSQNSIQSTNNALKSLTFVNVGPVTTKSPSGLKKL